MRAELTIAGRDADTVDIQVEVPIIDFTNHDAVRRALEQLDELRHLGATWGIVHVDASSVKTAGDYLTAFAETVIRQN